MMINGEYDNYYVAISRGFENALTLPDSKYKDRCLANLMSDMERIYKIPMNKERFEREIAEPVRELYLAISDARNL